jgi:uncharacterized coiled-coil DUF342 family protein
MTELSEFEHRVWGAVDRLDRKFDDMGHQVTAVREALIRVEATFNGYNSNHARLEAEVLTLKTKVAALEANGAKQTGLVVALEWVYKLGPWVALTLFALKSSLTGSV